MLDHEAAVDSVGVCGGPEAGLHIGQAAATRLALRQREATPRSVETFMAPEPAWRKTNIEKTPFSSGASSALADSSSDKTLKPRTSLPSWPM